MNSVLLRALRVLRVSKIIGLGLALSCAGLSAASSDIPIIAIAPQSGAQGDFAAREVRRYFYLRCGTLLPIDKDVSTPPHHGVFLVRNDSALLPTELKTSTAGIGDEEYRLKTTGAGDSRVDWIIGGGDQGLLYGAYRFAEKLGVRFYLHGDVVPDQPVRWESLPPIDEAGKPLFATRGVLPFHDFPEGPDWWTRDDYAVYLGQLPKMRMNFAGFHCYPESRVGPEPLVWIGRKSDLDEASQPRFSYPSFWFNTANDRWGFVPAKTSDYASGAGLLFENDAHGSPAMAGKFPFAETTEDSNRVFANTADLLGGVFARARSLGIKISVGTETPLTIPAAVAERLTDAGKNPKDPAVVEELYEGMFKRIAQKYPVDYYWLWTPEIWTWSGNDHGQFDATVSDIKAAQRALDSLGHPFTLATAGWVLGPLGQRTALDTFLPKTSPMSCISREVGHGLVEGGFAQVQGRPKWSMPWIENDPNLTAPQLWVGRMRYDAVDSLKLGCTGLIVNHWRTKIMAPNLAAVADAAWDQSYAPADWDLRARQNTLAFANDKKILGGTEFYSEQPVAGTDESFIYQRMREDLTGYDLAMPAGRYAVTLRFNEPSAVRVGERVFSIQIQGKTVEPSLDIFARVGARHALDLSYKDIEVTDQTLALRFQAHAGKTCLCALTIEGVTKTGEKFSRKMRCGRIEPVLEYEGDREGDRPTPLARNRTMPIEDFYIDFARANFGAAVATRAGKILAGLDGTNLPELGTWIRGPGGINARAISSPAFGLMHQLAALRSQVQGVGNLERFDYWLNTFRAFEIGAEIAAKRAVLDRTVAEGLNTGDPVIAASRGHAALTLRIEMARAWEAMISALIATVSTPGELGTIVDFEQHNRFRLQFLTVYDERIAALIHGPLPPAIEVGRDYHGTPRLIIPTVPNESATGEIVRLKVIALDHALPRKLQLHWRKLGEKEFQVSDAQHSARSTFVADLPATKDDIEYFVSGTSSDGQDLIWPATAPVQNQTIVRWEK